MLRNLFKKDSTQIQIYAPVSGEIVQLEDVPDPVFNQKMLGDGVALKPTEAEETIFAPIDGQIIHIPETKHAIGIRSKDGTEVLIHIGLETVSLKGKGFTNFVKTGDSVSIGQQLMKLDLEYIRKNASSDITPVIITNGQETERKYTNTNEKEGKASETVIITA